MPDIFAIRNVDENTKKFIQDYAHAHDLNIGEALQRIVLLVQQHLTENQTKKKKYKSFFDTYDKIAFSDSKYTSETIDKLLYEEKQ